MIFMPRSLDQAPDATCQSHAKAPTSRHLDSHVPGADRLCRPTEEHA